MPKTIYTANKGLIPALVLLLTFLFAMPAGAEYYYQYRDDNGNIHFTDDPGTVPEDKQSEMKRHRSVSSSATDAKKDSGREQGSAFQQREAAATGSWEMNLRRKTESLDRERTALKRQFEDLQSERNALGEPPPSSGSAKERYEAEVKALNQKIEAYEKRRKAFDEKASEFRSGRTK